MTTKAKTTSRSKKKLIASTDGLSDLDVGEEHVISEAEIEKIINEEELTPEAASKEEADKESNYLQSLTKHEFNITMSVLPLVQHAKKLVDKLEADLKAKKYKVSQETTQEIKQMMYASELGIWNSMAKKFGYKSLEEAQENGIKLSIKSGHFIQAFDA